MFVPVIAQNRQPIAVGIDPGSKGEGLTVKSQSHTYLNIQANSVDWGKDHIENIRTMRRSRRIGFKRGSLVKHSKYGISYIGGFMDSPTRKDPNRKVVSLHCLKTGKRLTQNAKPQDIKFLTYNTWRTRIPLPLKSGVSCAGTR